MTPNDGSVKEETNLMSEKFLSHHTPVLIHCPLSVN